MPCRRHLGFLALAALVVGVLPAKTEEATQCGGPIRCEGGQSHWVPKGKLDWTIDYSSALADGRLDVEAHDAYVLTLPVVAKARGKPISELRCTAKKKLICYTNCGAYEKDHWNEEIIDPVRGELIGAQMSGYPEERWLDIRRLDVMRRLIGDKFTKAASLGCDAMLCDNVEAWTTGTDGQDEKAVRLYREQGLDALKAFAAENVKARTGFEISYDDQIAYNRMLSEEAHSRCMGIGLLNDVFQIPDLADDFDFALNEQCHHCGWCDLYQPFVGADKPVLHLEFRDNEGFCKPGSAPIADICSAVKGMGLSTFNTLKKDASSRLHHSDKPETCR